MNAYLNHGRWIVPCSADDCLAVLSADIPRFPVDNHGTLALRCVCRDVSVCDHPLIPCGAPIEATFPDDKLVVDWLTYRRPRRMNRNWNPDETVDDLRRENAAHGLDSA